VHFFDWLSTKHTPWSRVNQNVSFFHRWLSEHLFFLFFEKRNNATPATNEVSISNATESCFSFASVRVSLNKQFFSYHFSCPIQIYGVHCFICTNCNTFSTELSIAASIIFSAPSIFVLTASIGLYSQVGTCFRAAAWTTISTPFIAL